MYSTQYADAARRVFRAVQLSASLTSKDRKVDPPNRLSDFAAERV